jgi:3-methylcrotonyl-CoA carboxylase alpha subunit
MIQSKIWKRDLNGIRTSKNYKIRCYVSEPGLFNKILIANRGEIACRVINTAKKLGIKTVAVFSEADRNARHVSMADEAFLLGPAQSQQSYLRGDKILEIAKRSGSQAIHPGYGFLSENAAFSAMCHKNDIVFIGPPASAITSMGSKSESKNIMAKASVPLIPGYHGEDQSVSVLLKEADKIGYPVLIKAVMGGGGKGMKIVDQKQDFEEALSSAKRESLNSFGDDRVLVEKYIKRPRHIEIQVFADTFGNTIYLFERDCSVQRRYQKIIEEAPAPHMDPMLRKKMGEAAVAAAKAVGYVGAGTVEFIFDIDSGNFFFMEMNTRLQVEHPITEMITKQDLVEWQLKVAAKHPLPMKQEDLKIHGHAFESRIYAENPDNNFLPGTGKLIHLSTPPISPHVRIDTGVRQGDEVSVFYDPMIAKLVTWDFDRNSALQRMRIALEQYKIVGLTTNTKFLQKLASHPAFIAGKVETGFIPKFKDDLLPPKTPANNMTLAIGTLSIILQENNSFYSNSLKSEDPHSPFGVPSGFRLNSLNSREITFFDNEKEINLQVIYNKDGSYDIHVPNISKPINVRGSLKDNELTAFVADELINATVVVYESELQLFYKGENYSLKIPIKDYSGSEVTKGSLVSPLPGQITEVSVTLNQMVKKGTVLMKMLAMKMEHVIRAPHDGIVEKINYKAGDVIQEKKQLLVIREDILPKK